MKQSFPKRLSDAWRTLVGSRAPRARSYFAGARDGRLTADWITSCISADEEVKASLRKLRGRARELARNEALIRRFLQLSVVNVIGPDGITLQAGVTNNSGEPAETINRKIELGWRDWARSVSVDGRLGLVSFEQLAYETKRTDGEVLVRLHRGFQGNRYGLALELIDADLLDENYNQQGGSGQNEVRMGVEVNSFGAPLAYWCWNRPQYLGTMPRERIRIPVEEVLHIFRQRRPNQTRGYTDFHPVMLPLRHLGGYREAEIVAARTAAAKQIFLVAQENAVLDPESGSSTPQVMEANAGQIDKLPHGWGIQQWDPQHPTTAFAEFTQQIEREIAVGLGVAYHSLTGDLGKTSFASSRTGTIDERDGWKNEQAWWIEQFESKIYPVWIRMALLRGAATSGEEGLVLDSRDPRKYLQVSWRPRRWDWVDPLNDVQATVVAIENGLACRTDEMDATGGNFRDTLGKLATEVKLAEEAGVSLGSSAASKASAASLTAAGETDANSGDGGSTAGSTDASSGSKKGKSGRLAALANGR